MAFIHSLSLLAGGAALAIAVYIQLVATDETPISYAIAYYLLGAGILLVLLELEWSYAESIIAVGVLSIIAAEYLLAVAIFRTYNISGPVDQLNRCRRAL